MGSLRSWYKESSGEIKRLRSQSVSFVAMGSCQCPCKDGVHENRPNSCCLRDSQLETSQDWIDVQNKHEEPGIEEKIIDTHPVIDDEGSGVTGFDIDAKEGLEASTEKPSSRRSISVDPNPDGNVEYESEVPRLKQESWSVMEIVTSISASEFMKSMQMAPAMPDPDFKPQGMRPVKCSSNHNRPCDYHWLQDILMKLSRNETQSLGCGDAETSEPLLPLFFVMGACPNVLCGMQVVMYCRSSNGVIDFWWVKPSKSKSTCGEGGFQTVERETLKRHCKGPYKNDPGRSMAFYKPLAVLFENASTSSGWQFGIEEVHCEQDGVKVPRAYLESVAPDAGKDNRKLYVYMFWQEDWSMNPFARQKYIKGKMVYQKSLKDFPPRFFSRQYEIVNDSFSIQDLEEPPVSSYIPPVSLKTLWEPDTDSSQTSSKSIFRGVWKS